MRRRVVRRLRGRIRLRRDRLQVPHGTRVRGRVNQLALNMDPKPFRATGPGDWLLSFRETQRELRCSAGLEAPAVRLVQHAAAVSGDRWIINQALCELVERRLLEPVSYAPWYPSPCFPPDPAYGCGGTLKAPSTEPHGWHARRSPAWQWVFLVARDVAKHLPPSRYWKIIHAGVTYSGEGPVPEYLKRGERLV
jgi:hypothetical protein